jgi:hypothetical protein
MKLRDVELKRWLVKFFATFEKDFNEIRASDTARMNKLEARIMALEEAEKSRGRQRPSTVGPMNGV